MTPKEKENKIMKQTAVEWYSEEHWKLFLQLESKEITTNEYIDEHQILLVQAKELEKEQLDERYFKGINFYETKFKNKCKHNRSDDPKAFGKEQFIGYYCPKCDEVYT